MGNYTVEEFIGAIEKNGYPQIFGAYFKVNDITTNARFPDATAEIQGACAVGQAMLNLNDNFIRVYEARQIFCTEHSEKPMDIVGYAIHLNDVHELSITKIVETLRAVDWSFPYGTYLHSVDI